MSDQKKEAKNKFIPYPKAIRILRDKLSATSEELAAWIFLGPETGGVSAYLDVDELDEPRLFRFDPWNRQADDYLAQIAQCWFLAEDIACFRPEARFITGRSLVDRWAELSSQTEPFIEAKIRESRLIDIHPITGGTLWNNDTPDDPDNPGNPYYPPKETALFELALVEKIEVEDGINPAFEKQSNFIKENPARGNTTINILVNPPNNQASSAKTEIRKQKTQAMYESWQKEYLALKKGNDKNKSDVWCSEKIAKMKIGKGREARTIRKNMKN